MRIIVTHTSPDMDAITSVWLLRKFLPGWEDATVKFVPAGERLQGMNQESRIKNQEENKTKNHNSLFIIHDSVIEKIGDDEVIHVDTGLGPLDHHQTADVNVCGASLTWEYIKVQSEKLKVKSSDRVKDRWSAIDRMVKVVVDTDHFKEVFWPSPTADYYEFSVGAVLDGLKLAKPSQDEYYVQFISECLDAILHEFENRIWAEKEIAENGHKFETRFGKGMGFETINDSVIKLAQKMGYVIVIRKDPRKGYVRIKALPRKGAEVAHENFLVRDAKKSLSSNRFKSPASSHNENFVGSPRQVKKDIDLTLAYEKLKKMDPSATWFLHIGKKMLLNGSVKNPKMRPTRLGLGEIIKVLEKI